MDKEKQIEDLTALIDSFTIKTYENAKAVAKFIIEKYNYRKIAENEVVISKEDYKNFKAELQKSHNKGVRAGFDMTKFKEYSIRKETAEKIFVEVLDLEELKVILDMGWEKTHNSIINEILELAKQFGVDL